MPCDLRFTLALASADGLPRPNARLWLDLSEDFTLSDGEEVRLTSVDRASWLGLYRLEDRDDPQGLFFVLRFVAPPGVGWTFTVKAGDTVVYETQPGLTTARARETLTGTLGHAAPTLGPTSGRPHGAGSYP